MNIFLLGTVDFTSVLKWGVIFLFVLCFIVGLIVCLTKKEYAKKTIMLILLSLFIALLIIGVTSLIMEITENFSEEIKNGSALFKLVFLPILCFILILVASIIFYSIYSKKGVNKKLVSTILLIINVLCLIAVGVLIAVYYDLKIKADGYYNSETASVNQPFLYLLSIVMIITIVAFCFIFDKQNTPFDTKCLTLAGICVAMSFGLSYIKLFKMPQGGSITFASLLPIMIFASVYGPKKGVLICLSYGVLQAVQDPYIIHPAQFLLDYPIAFAGIGLSGIFNNLKKLEDKPQVQFLLGGLLVGVIRFLCHLFSGVFAFSAYAGESNVWLYSTAYNSFVFIDLAIVLIAGFAVFSSKSFVKEMNKLKT